MANLTEFAPKDLEDVECVEQNLSFEVTEVLTMRNKALNITQKDLIIRLHSIHLDFDCRMLKKIPKFRFQPRSFY